MGLYTPNSQVWYPTTGDTSELNVLLATLASSIEEGVGARLAHQEIAVGLKASLPAGTGIPQEPVVAPYAVSGGNGDFAQGMTITNGIVTVQTAGMYIMSANLGIQPGSGQRTGAVFLRKNNTELGGAEILQSGQYYQTATSNVVVNCVAGDTLYVNFHSAGPQPGVQYGPQPIAGNLSLSSFSVSMIQALPL